MNRSIGVALIAAAVFCAVPGRSEERLQGDPRLGAAVSLSSGADAGKVLSAVQKLGVGWVRDSLRWDDLEKTPGAVVVPQRMLDWIGAPHTHHLRLLLALNGANKAYKDPMDAEAFAKFAGTVATKFKGSVDSYLLWEGGDAEARALYGGSETGMEKDKTPSPWVTKFTAALNAAAKAIHGVDPDVKIIAPGGPAPAAFHLAASGLGPEFTGMFGPTAPPVAEPELVPFAATPDVIARDGMATADAQGSYASQIRLFKEQVARYRGPGQVWETGMAGVTPGADAEKQVSYLLRRTLENLSLGVFSIAMPVGDGMGAAPADAAAAQRAAGALTRLTSFLDGRKAHFNFPVSSGLDGSAVRLYQFADDAGSPSLVLWKIGDAAGAPPVALSIEDPTVTAAVTATDLVTGQKTALKSSREGAVLKVEGVPLSGHPLVVAFGTPDKTAHKDSQPPDRTASRGLPYVHGGTVQLDSPSKNSLARAQVARQHASAKAGSSAAAMGKKPVSVAGLQPGDTEPAAPTRPVVKPHAGNSATPKQGAAPAGSHDTGEGSPASKPVAHAPARPVRPAAHSGPVQVQVQPAGKAIDISPNPATPGQTVTFKWFFTGRKVTISGGRFAPGTPVTGRTSISDRVTKATRYVFDVFYDAPGSGAAPAHPVHLRYLADVDISRGGSMATYRDPHGWQIQHPVKWKHENYPTAEGSDGLNFFQEEDDSVERMSLAIVPIGSTTLGDMAKKIRSDLPSHYSRLEVINEAEIVHSSIPAVWTEFQGLDESHPGTHTHSLAMVLVKNGKAYILSARTNEDKFKQRQASMTQMLRSFAFTR